MRSSFEDPLLSTLFTAMVKRGEYRLEVRMRKDEKAGAENSSVRATISFPEETYRTLEDIAKRKKVSLAWVVREASEQYINDSWPLLRGQNR